MRSSGWVAGVVGVGYGGVRIQSDVEYWYVCQALDSGYHFLFFWWSCFRRKGTLS